MKKLYVVFYLVFVLFSSSLIAQKSMRITPVQYGSIQTIEKRMQRIGLQFLSDTDQDVRVKGAREFVKLLVEALKVENSFQYRFDSLPYLAKVIPEDSSFRIFTFQVMLKNYTFVHYGCIQLNRKNIKLIPFKDYSDTFPMPPQYTITNKNWLGAVYYKILTKSVNNKPVYFLFGYDQNDLLTDKKYIEPMWIEGDSIAKFGIPMFEKAMLQVVAQDNKLAQVNTRPILPTKVYKTFYRYVLEYRKRASVVLKYDKEKDLITHDHIAPLDTKLNDVAFMKVPDGTYEGLKWDKTKQKWIWVDYVKLSNEEETNEPIRPAPIKDKKSAIPPSK